MYLYLVKLKFVRSKRDLVHQVECKVAQEVEVVVVAWWWWWLVALQWLLDMVVGCKLERKKNRILIMLAKRVNKANKVYKNCKISIWVRRNTLFWYFTVCIAL